jgi:hypothetical protein
MILTEPFEISSRLLPALKIDGAYLSLEYVKSYASGRMVFRWYLDLPDGKSYSEADLRSGIQGATYQQMFETLLGFLGAAADAYRYEMGGRESENADLFPPAVMEWAYQNADELGYLEYEIGETKGPIREREDDDE